MCLDDIKLAFRLGYPDDLAYKLYDRKAKCLIAFKQMADAGEAYKLAFKYVDKATKLSADRKKQVKDNKDVSLNKGYFYSKILPSEGLCLFFQWLKN